MNFSVRIESDEATPIGRPLHSVHEGGCLLARDREAGPVLATLLRHLDRHLIGGAIGPAIGAVALRRADGRLVLTSESVRRAAAPRRRWLAARGLELLPSPTVVLDPATGEAVVPPLSVDVATDELEGLGTPIEVLDELRTEQRASIHAWVLLSVSGSFEETSRARALEPALSALENGRHVGPVARMTGAAAALRTAVPIAAGGIHRDTVVDRLPELA